jgi:hypothetical protein
MMSAILGHTLIVRVTHLSLLIVACRCCLLLLAAGVGAGVGVLFSPSLLGRLESVTPQWLMLLLRRR